MSFPTARARRGALTIFVVPPASLVAAPPPPAARATRRIATHNIDVPDPGSIPAPPGMYTILKGMGDLKLNNPAQPIDVLSLTEVDSIPSRTLQPMCDELNKIY